MYLEKTEQTEVSGEGTLSTDSMLSEQCQIPKLTKAADLILSSTGRAELDLNVLAELASQEMNSSKLRMEHCNSYEDYTDTSQPCTYCNGDRFETYSEIGTILECDTVHDKTLRLSQQLEGYAQHCECCKTSLTSEHCVNHSFSHSDSPCCEHCTEQQVFQQHEPTDYPSGSFDLAVDKLDVNCDSFKQGETSNCMSEYVEHPVLSQQYKPSGMQYKFLEALPESSTEDREKHEMTGFIPNASESVDGADCGAELCEYDDIQNHSITEDNDERYSTDDGQEEGSVSEYVNCLHLHRAQMQVYYDESERHTDFERTFEQTTKADMSKDHHYPRGYEDSNQDYETSQQGGTSEQNNSDKTYEGFFIEEEDSASDCSSSESKSFKTCSDDCENCLDSSGESEKAQEDSSDEQTQWDSFEDDEDIEQGNMRQRMNDEKKTPTSDFVVEDYFDFFDRGDYRSPAFTQRQHYISCFDGGDIHECLHNEQLKEKKQAQNMYKVQEIHPQVTETCFYSSENACDNIYGCLRRDTKCMSCKSDAQPEELKAENELDDDLYEGNNVNEDNTSGSTPESEICLSPEDDENVDAPYVDNIYKGNSTDILISESPEKTTSTTHNEQPATNNTLCCHQDMFSDCSEKESYWALIDSGIETFDSGVEEYYAYQIKSIDMVILNDQKINTRTSSWSEDPLVTGQNKIDFQYVEIQEDFSKRGQCKDSNGDSLSNEISREVGADIIHSVVSEYHKIEEGDTRTEESEEENSDSDFYELCDCEYCIPPKKQTSAKALLPQMKSNDTGKICVVIDLDETLVHSSFTPVNNADFITPVDIDGTVHQVYVSKRPHVDEFLRRMGEMFECILFTASLSKYADPVSDILDKSGAFRSRLFREACVFHKGNYVKDLSHLGRDLNKVIIIDNSPASYIFHPDNAVPVASWFDDMSDCELLDLIPFFERLSNVDDIYDLLKQQRALG